MVSCEGSPGADSTPKFIQAVGRILPVTGRSIFFRAMDWSSAGLSSFPSFLEISHCFSKRPPTFPRSPQEFLRRTHIHQPQSGKQPVRPWLYFTCQPHSREGNYTKAKTWFTKREKNTKDYLRVLWHTDFSNHFVNLHNKDLTGSWVFIC